MDGEASAIELQILSPTLPLRPLIIFQRLRLVCSYGEFHHALRDLKEHHNVGKSIFSGQSG